jgi:hypothetical protein
MRRAFALVVLALPLAACGGNGGTSNVSSSVPALAQAATKSASASTLKIDLQMSETATGLAHPITMSATGVEDNTNHRVDMHLDMSSLAANLGGTVKQFSNPAEWQGEEIGDLSNGHFVMYMHLPLLSKLVPGGKPWIKFDLSAVGKSLGVNFSQLTQVSGDPGQTLDWLRSTSGAITDAGPETIDGVETTHYKASIDLAKYPNLVPLDRRAAVRRTINSLISLTGLRSFPVDAWISSDGLVRKLRMSFSEDVNGQQVTSDMTMRFHDFNAPVSISLPPAGQTLDVTKLALGAAKP